MSKYNAGEIIWYKSFFTAYTGEIFTIRKTPFGYRYFIKCGDSEEDIWRWRYEWRLWK